MDDELRHTDGESDSSNTRTRWLIVLRTGIDGDDERAIRGLKWICKTAGRGWGLKVIVIRRY
jgi:hypothetical protein